LRSQLKEQSWPPPCTLRVCLESRQKAGSRYEVALKVDNGRNGVPGDVTDTLSGLTGPWDSPIIMEAVALTARGIMAPERLQPALTYSANLGALMLAREDAAPSTMQE
jgi:hypothetical protein